MALRVLCPHPLMFFAPFNKSYFVPSAKINVSDESGDLEIDGVNVRLERGVEQEDDRVDGPDYELEPTQTVHIVEDDREDGPDNELEPTQTVHIV